VAVATSGCARTRSASGRGRATPRSWCRRRAARRARRATRTARPRPRRAARGRS
jgi:hypothetical protein